MLRSLRTITEDPLEFLAAQWRRHGDVLQFPIPSPPTYLVSHPDDVRQVLVTHARQTTKSTIQYRALSAVTGQGLLTSDGVRWREHRRVVQPAFHPSTLAGVAGHTAAAAQRLLDRLSQVPEGGLVDVDAEVMAVALEVVGDSLFGHELAPVAHRLAEATLTALGEVVRIARMPVRAPHWIPTAGNRRMASSLRELDSAVEAILERKALDGPADPADLVDLLLTSDLDRQAVRDEIVTFLVAGHETVASALGWALVLLGNHPAVADLVADEARAVLGPTARPAGTPPATPAEGHAAALNPAVPNPAVPNPAVPNPAASAAAPDPAQRPIDLATLARLRTSRAVIDEAMRLYPPAWLITRTTSTALELSGRHLPAGSLVIISPWIVHRHPDAWADADEFLPERFLNPPSEAGTSGARLVSGAGTSGARPVSGAGTSGARPVSGAGTSGARPVSEASTGGARPSPAATGAGGRSRAAFIPFGAGPRMCIGRDFAYAESVLALSMLCRSVRLEPSGAPVRPRPLVTIRPDRPTLMRITPRSAPH